MTFRIKAPDFYKTRDNRKVKITGDSGLITWPWGGIIYLKDGGEDRDVSWTSSGIYSSDCKAGSPADIIGFWDDSEPLSIPDNKVLLLLKKNKTTTNNQRKSI